MQFGQRAQGRKKVNTYVLIYILGFYSVALVDRRILFCILVIRTSMCVFFTEILLVNQRNVLRGGALQSTKKDRYR
jgi:hypothetical protein